MTAEGEVLRAASASSAFSAVKALAEKTIVLRVSAIQALEEDAAPRFDERS
jgi:hypothetical protein